MYYHASKYGGLKTLKPHVSMHGKSWVYFSDKRENVLVYLSNAVEKYIKEKYNRPMKVYEKWASYGFTSDGRLRLEEYYPNATLETFKGVEGYIYLVEELKQSQTINNIRDVFVTHEEVTPVSCEKISDAYEEILKAEQEGKIVVERYETITDKKREVIKSMITKEFENTDNEDYKDFLLNKFTWLKK